MKKLELHVKFLILFFVVGTAMLSAQNPRIMPLGNSITYDHNSTDVSTTTSRPIGVRISYRFRLYELITAAGYSFDFVGSENSGGNFLGSELDDNAGFPGITDDELAVLINTGYNARIGGYETPVPNQHYLNYYPADIILLHIGTNDLTTSSADVEDILDNIRYFDSDVIILVARIINRATYHLQTTQFNDNVEAMVNARNDNRIIMVDLENGAGINYGTDMVDNLHPNPTGYNKMAQKWFEAIMDLNSKPVIAQLPEQVVSEGTDFPPINLDDIVTDIEDPDYLLSWSFSQEPSAELNVSIDANRVLHVTPPQPEWSGSETITLYVQDTGSDSFIKKDTTEIVFTVNEKNDPPVISGQQAITIDENTSYNVSLDDLSVTDSDNLLSELSVNVVSGNNYSYTGSTFYPAQNYYGALSVNIEVCDPLDCSTSYTLTVTVLNVNDPPVFTSTPVESADDYEPYSYTVAANDPNSGDVVTLFGIEIPDWLTFDANTATLTGTPEADDTNISFSVAIGATDQQDTAIQQFNIFVTDNNSPPEFTTKPDTIAYPDSMYTYQVNYTDVDSDDELSLSVISKPDWLIFVEATSTLTGIPPIADAGKKVPVILQLTDGDKIIYQTFSILVEAELNVLDIFKSERRKLQVYPNPVRNSTITVVFPKYSEEGKLSFYTSSGIQILCYSILAGLEKFQTELPELTPGMYIISYRDKSSVYSGRFLVSE